MLGTLILVHGTSDSDREDRFLVDDVEAEWLNGDDFDFVHLRNMIPILKSPVGLLKQVYQYISPVSLSKFN